MLCKRNHRNFKALNNLRQENMIIESYKLNVKEDWRVQRDANVNSIKEVEPQTI